MLKTGLVSVKMKQKLMRAHLCTRCDLFSWSVSVSRIRVETSHLSAKEKKRIHYGRTFAPAVVVVSFCVRVIVRGGGHVHVPVGVVAAAAAAVVVVVVVGVSCSSR